MKINEIKELGLNINENDIEVDLMRIVEHHYFNRPTKKDYRIEAIDFCIKRKLPFHTTTNNAFVIADASGKL